MKSLFTFLLASLLLVSCRDASELYPPTTIKIIDPVRHYYPVVQGELFEINISVKNTGEHFLRAGETGYIKIINDSKKNIGYVKHFIKIYGNFPNGETEVVFDYNVVPDALYTPDYEEIYSKENKSNEVRRQKYYTDKK